MSEQPPQKILFFQIFQHFQNFFEKRPQRVLENIERNKVMEYELNPTPCRIVLKLKLSKFK